ncbi:MAG: PrsW family glutamic-type intramembrane protease [Acidobacteriota bacterium]
MIIALAFLPVCIFLSSLLYLDSYKLVHLRTLLKVIVSGSAVAVISYFLNNRIFQSTSIDHAFLVRFVTPLLEEFLKALPVLFLLRTRRIGFLVDAAIFGFAAGAGFALVENLYYMLALNEGSLGLWVVRGFGTAVMHGGCTAILAMTAKVMMERRESEAFWLMLPGLAIAFSVHSLFNQFVLSPMMSAVVIILALPPLLMIVFSQSERFLQSWLGTGFDIDSELLAAIHSDEFDLSRPGHYLQSLREHFGGPVLADMLCFLRLHAELSLRAKGILMMRESGFPVVYDEEVSEKLTELRFLKQSIGKTGELALAPILHRSAHDLWQLRMLERTVAGGQSAA